MQTPQLEDFAVSAQSLRSASFTSLAPWAEAAELVNDAEIAGFTPEICEPPPYDGLVVFFFGRREGAGNLAKLRKDCQPSRGQQSCS